jgi:Na+-translocating ferredoxin:NAD+ oxidoreductase RNF subunit RnfB
MLGNHVRVLNAVIIECTIAVILERFCRGSSFCVSALKDKAWIPAQKHYRNDVRDSVTGMTK